MTWLLIAVMNGLAAILCIPQGGFIAALGCFNVACCVYAIIRSHEEFTAG